MLHENNYINYLKCQQVILEPGDALYIPKHWWHFVRNIEASISVNMWITKVHFIFSFSLLTSFVQYRHRMEWYMP